MRRVIPAATVAALAAVMVAAAATPPATIVPFRSIAGVRFFQRESAVVKRLGKPSRRRVQGPVHILTYRRLGLEFNTYGDRRTGFQTFLLSTTSSRYHARNGLHVGLTLPAFAHVYPRANCDAGGKNPTTPPAKAKPQRTRACYLQDRRTGRSLAARFSRHPGTKREVFTGRVQKIEFGIPQG